MSARQEMRHAEADWRRTRLPMEATPRADESFFFEALCWVAYWLLVVAAGVIVVAWNCAPVRHALQAFLTWLWG